MRKIKFVKGEYYHIFNRGVDKRIIFKDVDDLGRFFLSMNEFNTLSPIGSIFENSFRKKNNKQLSARSAKLVEIVAYCLNPNHYHFILKPLVENGIEKFMQKLGSGYTMYFNCKNKRTGVLFQGKFKAVHINSDDKFLRTVVYVNKNDKIHQLSARSAKLVKSSWGEYTGESRENICNKKVVLDQFKNLNDFRRFTKELLPLILEEKEMWNEMEK